MTAEICGLCGAPSCVDEGGIPTSRCKSCAIREVQAARRRTIRPCGYCKLCGTYSDVVLASKTWELSEAVWVCRLCWKSQGMRRFDRPMPGENEDGIVERGFRVTPAALLLWAISWFLVFGLARIGVYLWQGR